MASVYCNAQTYQICLPQNLPEMLRGFVDLVFLLQHEFANIDLSATTSEGILLTGGGFVPDYYSSTAAYISM